MDRKTANAGEWSVAFRMDAALSFSHHFSFQDAANAAAAKVKATGEHVVLRRRSGAGEYYFCAVTWADGSTTKKYRVSVVGAVGATFPDGSYADARQRAQKHANQMQFNVYVEAVSTTGRTKQIECLKPEPVVLEIRTGATETPDAGEAADFLATRMACQAIHVILSRTTDGAYAVHPLGDVDNDTKVYVSNNLSHCMNYAIREAARLGFNVERAKAVQIDTRPGAVNYVFSQNADVAPTGWRHLPPIGQKDADGNTVIAVADLGAGDNYAVVVRMADGLPKARNLTTKSGPMYRLSHVLSGGHAIYRFHSHDPMAVMADMAHIVRTNATNIDAKTKG